MISSVDRTTTLVDRLDKGELDLALIFGCGARSDAELLATLPLAWIAPRTGEHISMLGESLPLAVLEAPCFFREAATTALDKVGIPWRIAFTSPSLPGIWAAVEAGLGITLRTVAGLPASLVVLDDRSGLSSLPPIELSLHDGGRKLTPAALRLKEILLDTLAANPAAISKAKSSVGRDRDGILWPAEDRVHCHGESG